MCFVSTETLKSFTDDELAMLLFLVNTSVPRMLPYDLTPHELRMIHLWKFKEIMARAEPNLSDVGKPIFIGLSTKLGLL
jgi:hypothetical protein